MFSGKEPLDDLYSNAGAQPAPTAAVAPPAFGAPVAYSGTRGGRPVGYNPLQRR